MGGGKELTNLPGLLNVPHFDVQCGKDEEISLKEAEARGGRSPLEEGQIIKVLAGGICQDSVVLEAEEETI